MEGEPGEEEVDASIIYEVFNLVSISFKLKQYVCLCQLNGAVVVWHPLGFCNPACAPALHAMSLPSTAAHPPVSCLPTQYADWTHNGRVGGVRFGAVRQLLKELDMLVSVALQAPSSSTG